MVLMSAGAAFAHHPLGGMTPQTAMHGFLSGVGHPVIGFDHLAFIIGVGLIAAFHRNKLAMPAAFVAGTVGGTMLTLAAVSLPLAEIVITGSVVAAGVVAMRGKIIDLRVAAILAAAAGLFHGWAYGAAVIGAETTPVIAYLVGFGMIQMLIAGGVALATARVWKIIDVAALQPRLAGAVVAGVGLAFLVENVEGMIFSAL
jgi:urease accessory protein